MARFCAVGDRHLGTFVCHWGQAPWHISVPLGTGTLARYLGPVGDSAGAGRLHGLLARRAKIRGTLGPGVGSRRTPHLAGCSADAGWRYVLQLGSQGKDESAFWVLACPPAHGADTLPQFEHAASSTAAMLPQSEYASSFGPSGESCTQFYPTLHASGAWYTHFLTPRKLREAVNPQVDEVSIVSGSAKNCVLRTSSACTVGQNCVHRTSSA